MTDINSEDLAIDFTDVEGAGGFTPLPNGRYLLEVTDWELTETKNPGKLPVGTPGIKWEFTVVDGEHENRKLWANHWIAATTLPFLKGFLAATGVFTEEQLNGPLGSVTDIGEKVLEAEARVCAKVGRQRGNDDYNDIKGFFPADQYKGQSSGGGSSMMP
jgi:hypothetical protein